jgi:hypothetical protein
MIYFAMRWRLHGFIRFRREECIFQRLYRSHMRAEKSGELSRHVNRDERESRLIKNYRRLHEGGRQNRWRDKVGDGPLERVWARYGKRRRKEQRVNSLEARARAVSAQ